jgi:hypothetical protein
LNDVLDRVISLVEGGIDFAVGAKGGGRLMMEGTISKGTAGLLVREDEQ